MRREARVKVISDLHITGCEDPLYTRLLGWLSGEALRSGDSVVLAGDIFDLWVGSHRFFTSQYGAFREALEALLQKGVVIHYIEGNHDFGLRGALPQGVRLHTKKVRFKVGEKVFFIAHGDLVDGWDIGYRLLRVLLRTPVSRLFFFLAPGRFWRWVQGCLQRKQGPRLAAELDTQKLERLRRIFRNFAVDQMAKGADFMILGHCHDLDEKQFILDQRKGHYMNVGYPRAHNNYVSWKEGEEALSRERLED